MRSSTPCHCPTKDVKCHTILKHGSRSIDESWILRFGIERTAAVSVSLSRRVRIGLPVMIGQSGFLVLENLLKTSLQQYYLRVDIRKSRQ